MAVTKAKARTKSKAVSVEMTVNPSNPASVSIERADNGYTVSAWMDGNRKQMIAKSGTEAMRHAKAMLEGGK